ncbi:MAG: hypothetical protein RBU21_09910 [FCB group bacterium]|jgi:hypothetical protein|nr:hypothetical protein [FCB group bacterium]
MRILSGALPATESFLHVGYISAYPREFRPNSTIDGKDIFLQGIPIDVETALRLKDEAPVSEAAADRVQLAGFGGQPLAVSGPAALLLGVFFLGVMALYAAKQCGSARKRAVLLGVVAACALSGVASLFAPSKADAYRLPPPDTKAPWEGVTTRAYVDPESATRVLMHGIVGDALANANNSVRTLPQIKDEVGLPVAQPTEGERYALQTYGLDGWGQPFRLEGLHLDIVEKSARYSRPGIPVGSSNYLLKPETPRYVLTSAGPDGEFGTSDDLIATIKAFTETCWDEGFRGLYLHRNGDSYAALFHRWRGLTFKYRDRQRAAEIAGSDLYDYHTIGTWDDSATYLPAPPDAPKSLTDVAKGHFDRTAAGDARLLLLIQPAEMNRI